MLDVLQFNMNQPERAAVQEPQSPSGILPNHTRLQQKVSYF